MGTRPNEIPHAGELGELAFLNRETVPSLSNSYTKTEANALFLTDEVIGTKPDQVPLVGMLARRAFTDGPLGTADILDGAITTEKIAPGAVVTADLADAAVTTGKVADSAVTTAKLASSSVTRAKLGESTINVSAAQATQSGTVKDFTGIPSWARRVVLLLYGVSTNGTSDLLIQLGGGVTPVTSGYINGQSIFAWGSGVLSSTSTAGIPIYNNAASYVWSGRVVMELLEPGLNNWVVTATLNNTVTSPSMVVSSGIAALGANVLGMVRITTASGTPTLDAGYASISWE